MQNVELIEGDLTAVKKAKNSKFENNDKQRIWSELKGYQAERALAGKRLSDGWCSNSYKDIFGVWPRKLNDRALTPSEQVRGLIKHKSIAWAKSKSKLKFPF